MYRFIKVGIETLNGFNFSNWKQKIEITLGILDLDLALRAIPDEDNAESFVSKLQEQFVFPTKSLANALMTKLLTTRYDGHNSIQDHIMQMINITNQLKSIDIDISKETWNLNEVQIMCVQEEEILNQNKLKNRKYFFCIKKRHLKKDCFKYKTWLENKSIH
ncbi:hypothetical protein AMTRI_Chr05g58860 [Amborella trichopoda]